MRERGSTVCRTFRALLLIPMLAGCAELFPQAQERGDCTLDLVTERIIHSNPLGPDEMIELQPPYVVTLKRADPGGPPDVPPAAAYLVLEGHGWPNPEGTRDGDPPPGLTTASVVAPDGTESFLHPGIRDPLFVEHVLDRPGMWTFTVEAQVGDCRRTVSVEVLPPQ